MTVVRCFHIGPKGQAGQYKSVADGLARRRGREGFLWIDVADPTREELALVARALGLSDLSVEDCIDASQVPKFENFDDYTFLLVNTCAWRDRALALGETDVMIGRDFLVTVHTPPADGRDVLAGLDDHIGRSLDRASRGPDALAHVILDHLVDRMFETVEAIQEEIDRAEEAVLETPESFVPTGILEVRRGLLTLRKSLYHEREIFTKIARRDSPFVSEAELYPFRDLYDHLAKYYETVEIEREMVGNLMDLYMAAVNNRLASTSNDINVTMRKLTIVTVVFMPLTFLSGVGGMSEFSMMTGPENWKVAYATFFAASAAIGGITYGVLRWLRWF